MVEKFNGKQEIASLREQMNYYELQIRLNVENDNNVRAIKHDMKHHIRELKTFIYEERYNEAKDYITSMDEQIVNLDKVFNTGNCMMDGLLNYYHSILKEQGVRCEFSISVPENMNIKLYDLNIVLGNLLDNAVEYVLSNDSKDLEEVNKAFVILEIKYVGYALNIYVENSYHGSIEMKDGRIASKKGKNHGYGLVNVEKLVKKYGGDIIFSNDNNVFSTGIVMYF